MKASDITEQFIAAWNAMDVDAILGFFTEDAVYTNIPMEPANQGIDEIRTFIDSFLGSCTSINFIVHHQVESADGRVLMNERTDIIEMNGQKIELPVTGVFEFRGDKICAWRDYFDMGQFTAA